MKKIIFLFFTTTIPYWQQRAPYNQSTVTLLTKSVDQSGANKFCNSTNGTVQFTCSFNNTQVLTQYTKGMVLLLFTDSGGTSCTINIDGLGSKSIKDSLTGTIDAPVTANQPHLIFYDGVVFRLLP